MSDAYTTNDNREPHETPEDKRQPHVAFDPLKYAGMPPGGYEPHPLFPREDNSPELRDIQFVSFRRRSSDGTIDNLAEDIPAGEVLTWAEVIGPWGGGEYKAIGKDKNHRIVAWYPERNGEWVRFNLESKPFALRAARYRSAERITAPPAPPAAQAPAAPYPPYAPPAAVAPPGYYQAPTPHPLDAQIAEMYHAFRSRELAQAHAPAPAAPHPFEARIDEVLRELRSTRTPAPATNEMAMVEMIKSQGELLRAVLTQRPVESSSSSKNDPMTMALQFINAFQKLTPQPQTQPTIHDRLAEYKTIRELTMPNAAPASEFGEIKDLVMSVMQADAIGKSTRDMATPPPILERRPPPPPPPSPPPPPAPLQHVPGIGIVRVEQPERPALRTDDRAMDYEALQRDPAERQRMIRALGLDRPVPPAPPAALTEAPQSFPVTVAPTPAVSFIAATPAPTPAVSFVAAAPAPSAVEPIPAVTFVVAAPPPSAVEPIPAVAFVPAAPPPMDLLDAAWDPIPPLEPAPIVPEPPIEMATPSAAVDDRTPIALPEQMPIAEPHVATAEERKRAEGSLAKLAGLPRDQLRRILCKIPGVGTNVEEIMSAFGDLPPSAYAFVTSNLPADTVQALGRLEG